MPVPAFPPPPPFGDAFAPFAHPRARAHTHTHTHTPHARAQINFLLVPPGARVLYVASMGAAWGAYLSWLNSSPAGPGPAGPDRIGPEMPGDGRR